MAEDDAIATIYFIGMAVFTVIGFLSGVQTYDRWGGRQGNTRGWTRFRGAIAVGVFWPLSLLLILLWAIGLMWTGLQRILPRRN